MTTSMMRTRLPPDLKKWLETRSIRNFRSMNAEIVAILFELRCHEQQGTGLEYFANPSGIPGTIELGSKEEDEYRKGEAALDGKLQQAYRELMPHTEEAE